MSGRDYDAIIVGASFAGLAVARQLRGRVLLLDRNEVGAVQTSACGTPLWVPQAPGCGLERAPGPPDPDHPHRHALGHLRSLGRALLHLRLLGLLPGSALSVPGPLCANPCDRDHE